ncbi:DUF4157 domain-containing protein [Haliangium sp.]|uniref:eCIS core domain-containing protein n=1 Tax=Haliangium sp. TaxID=2663208 RepID=UPI003D11D9C5
MPQGDERAEDMPVQGHGPIGEDTENVHELATQGVSGAGARLPHLDRIQTAFGSQHDLSNVQTYTGGAAGDASSKLGADAYTRGERIAFRNTPDLRLAAHEAAHVVQQRGGVHLPGGVGTPGDAYERHADDVAARVAAGQSASDLLSSTPGNAPTSGPVQFAIPVAVIWGAKAVAATTFDAFIDFAIAAVLGLPAPGALDHVGNFLINLVPFLGEAKKVKKIKKLLQVVGKIVGPIQKMRSLKVPGATKLVENLLRQARKLKDELRDLNLDGAKKAFSTLLGYVREAQVATKLQKQGAVVEHLGKNIKRGSRQLTDIDVVTREGSQLVLTQVKAGNGAMLTPGSNSWKKFANQAERTKEAAATLADPATGAVAKVRYVVDDITPEARSFLEGLGFTVELSGSFLK